MITKAVFDWADRTPDKPAIVYNGVVWSYRSLAELIAVARGYFARRGCAGPGVAVLKVPNLMEFWVLSLALRSLGLTTIASPSTEAVSELRLLDVRCVVTGSADAWPGLAELCAAQGFELLVASLEGETALGLDEVATPNPPGGHILRTSGTTGDYKMVHMDPSFEAEFARDRREILGVGQDSVVAAFNCGAWTGIGYNSPISTWLVGATVVIDQWRDAYLGLLYPGITHAMVTPAMLAAILAAPAGAFPRNERMHLSVVSGTITQAQIDETRARITPRIFNRVGSTEVNTFANTALETPDDHRWHRLVPSREVQIVDEFDRPVPIGEVGRVRVSTSGGPTSYLHDAEMTRAFFKDGFFYPGDLAIMREDGRMALQGRYTDVINIKGHKIMPAPIEDRLREAFGVSGACLVSVQDNNGEEELNLVIETRSLIDTPTLTAVLSRELQGFSEVRVHYATVLPRTGTGKVLRQAVTALAIAARAAPR
jgi:acyl-coenzyme A synthetase/AMP-(fatty) acid ligase